MTTLIRTEMCVMQIEWTALHVHTKQTRVYQSQNNLYGTYASEYTRKTSTVTTRRWSEQINGE